MKTESELYDSNPRGDSAAGRHRPGTDFETPDNLFRSYWRLFREFRREDLKAFCGEHRRLYQQAEATGDYLDATRHYYRLMASLIATYYGDGWHFCPPEHDGQSRQDATRAMYRRVIRQLQINAKNSVLDVGCGEGGMLRFVARTSGARAIGITLGENEVQRGNELAAAAKLSGHCQLVKGDSQAMPFNDASFDAAYAVYALKYYPDKTRVLSEIHRVLKPGGRFVAYCLCKSDLYRDDNSMHVRLLRNFEYSTAMPRLQTVQQIIAAAEACGLKCLASEDISKGCQTWFSWWVRSPLLPWAISSRVTYGLTRLAEGLHLLPRGFAEFNDTFLAGTIRHIIRGGRLGILTGSALLTFERPAE